MPRAEIENERRFHQAIRFDDMQRETLGMTDIDGFFEYRNKLFVFYEVKYRDVEVPNGQKLAYTRLVDNLVDAGKIAALMVCEHGVEDCNEDIMLADTNVRSIYAGGGLWLGGRNLTAKQQTDALMDYAERHSADYYIEQLGLVNRGKE